MPSSVLQGLRCWASRGAGPVVTHVLEQVEKEGFGKNPSTNQRCPVWFVGSWFLQLFISYQENQGGNDNIMPNVSFLQTARRHGKELPKRELTMAETHSVWAPFAYQRDEAKRRLPAERRGKLW